MNAKQPPEAGAKRVLHVNINTTDPVKAGYVYESLSLKCAMRSESRGAVVENDPLGNDGPTSSNVLFFYDHRGGRKAPAVELVEWLSPATSGSHYEDPSEIGLQGVGFAVPSVEEAVDALVAAGATLTKERITGISAEPQVVLTDLDGVRVELFHDPDAPSPTFRRIRLSVGDLNRSVRWYEAIGWIVAGPPERQRWHHAASPEGTEVEVVRLYLPRDPAMELWLTQWPSTGRQTVAHQKSFHRGLFRMALSVDDVYESVERVSSDVVTVPSPTRIELPGTPLGELWISFLRDPDGVIVEFVPRP